MNTAGTRKVRLKRRTQGAICVLTAAAALSGEAVSVLSAQSAPVMLVARPRVGDTLFLQVEQSVTMRARRGDANGASASSIGASGGERQSRSVPEYGPRAERAQMTRVQLFAHSAVESSDLQRTSLIATTDSISMWAGDPSESPIWQRVPLAADVRRMRVLVSPDGAMRIADAPPGARVIGATLGSLPGLLPDVPVRTGAVWKREMPLPSLPLTGYHADGVVQAELRLDSLTRNGREAWISLTGKLRRDGAARELPPGTRVITAGTIRGSMRVDRVRAWIMDAATWMDVVSEVVPGPAVSSTAMLLDLRIEQRLRVR